MLFTCRRLHDFFSNQPQRGCIGLRKVRSYFKVGLGGAQEWLL